MRRPVKVKLVENGWLLEVETVIQGGLLGFPQPGAATETRCYVFDHWDRVEDFLRRHFEVDLKPQPSEKVISTFICPDCQKPCLCGRNGS